MVETVRDTIEEKLGPLLPALTALLRERAATQTALPHELRLLPALNDLLDEQALDLKELKQ
jgi:hypothetical protein